MRPNAGSREANALANSVFVSMLSNLTKHREKAYPMNVYQLYLLKKKKKQICTELRKSSLQWTCVVVSKMTELSDCQGFTFRTIGSIGKRDRRFIRHNRDGSYNSLSATSNRMEAKFPEARNEYSTRRDSYYARNNRMLSVGNNTDSGLGESTPQDFSSCCSSSADSSKPVHIVRISVCSHFCYHLCDVIFLNILPGIERIARILFV